MSQILNAHPNVVISVEADILGRFQNNELTSKEEVLESIIKRDIKRGLNNNYSHTGYEYKIDSGFQYGHDQLQIIGNKKQGRNANLLKKEPELLQRFGTILNLPIRVISVVRHPLDNISTLLIKSKCDAYDKTTIKRYVNAYSKRSETVNHLMNVKSYDLKTHIIKLEELILAPRRTITECCDFLQINVDDTHLDACQRIIFKKI